MNDDELERSLSRLGQSMAPGADFTGRVMERIQGPVRPRALKWWWIPAGVATAASVLLAVVLTRPRQPAQVPTPSRQLIRTSTEWQELSERPITLDGEIPARELDRQKFECVKWTDPASHATYQQIIPGERSKLVTLVSY